MPRERWSQYSTVFLRCALGTAFLSSVADRFGVWGAPGQPGANWGDFAHFQMYAAQVNAFLPPPLIPLVAWVATILEAVLGVMLIVGLCTRAAAVASGGLLLLFALAMTVSLGIKKPFEYSVFSASAGAFLLAASPVYHWTLEALLQRHVVGSQRGCRYESQSNMAFQERSIEQVR
jgi:uncharacterized membrane protein YphA (DoxX/SURF4 family)